METTQIEKSLKKTINSRWYPLTIEVFMENMIDVYINFIKGKRYCYDNRILILQSNSSKFRIDRCDDRKLFEKIDKSPDCKIIVGFMNLDEFDKSGICIFSKKDNYYVSHYDYQIGDFGNFELIKIK
jgi:hypothetical protein